MAIEIKNELRAAAIVDGSDGGAALQLFGLTFERTGVGVYVFTMDGAVDPTQLSIYGSPGINELTLPRGRFTSPTVLEVRRERPNEPRPLTWHRIAAGGRRSDIVGLIDDQDVELARIGCMRRQGVLDET